MSQMIPQGPPPGAGAPPGAGPPPGLLEALLQAHGAGAQAGPQGPPQAGPGDEREPIAILKQMIALAQRYMQVEPDAEDQATMAKLMTTLHQYLAKEQSDAEGALGGGAPTRLLRRLGQ